jgi:hypothetical protein
MVIAVRLSAEQASLAQQHLVHITPNTVSRTLLSTPKIANMFKVQQSEVMQSCAAA